ncbi:neuropeptide B [Chelonoidis abingdonii]|uniref:neuropeptide B n=1 Tax=Chelonoidis abingdonii TaxID=106734 RepID=UPI003F49192E
MQRASARALLCLALPRCLPARPGLYKQAAGPAPNSVGRASRTPVPGSAARPTRPPRRETGQTAPSAAPAAASPSRRPGASRSTALCVKDLALELPNCQLLSGAPSTIQCKADVTISLDPSDCNST